MSLQNNDVECEHHAAYNKRTVLIKYIEYFASVAHRYLNKAAKGQPSMMPSPDAHIDARMLFSSQKPYASITQCIENVEGRKAVDEMNMPAPSSRK